MHVVLNNYESYLSCDPIQARVVSEALTYVPAFENSMTPEEDVQFYWRHAAAGWVGIRSGLYEFVAQLAVQHNWQITLEDRRTHPSFQNVFPNAVRQFEPYPDQAEIVERMIHRTRGVLDLATNYGKTFLLVSFWFRVNCGSMLVLVPTTTLLEQTSDDIERLSGLPRGSVGRVGDGTKEWRPVTVAVVNSVDDWIVQHGQLPYHFETMFVDEGHLSVADRMDRISSHCDSFYRFWMSGTPWRDGNRGHAMNITGHSGPTVAQVTNQFLVSVGRSADPTINFVNVETGSYSTDGDFHTQYKTLKELDYRNDLIASIVYQATLKRLVAIVFVEHKDHLRLLSQRIPYAETVYGGSASQSVKRKLEDRSARCVISTSKWRQGVSVPGIDVLVHAAGLKAPANVIQEFGRVLRKKEYGGNKCYYVDLFDKWASHPKRHSTRRWATMLREGFPMSQIEPDKIGRIFS